jgi:hypothetical protein
MTDPDDLMLASLFQNADDVHDDMSGPLFTQQVMARVNEGQAKRKILVDTLALAAVAGIVVTGIVLAPTAWPQIEGAWIKSTTAYGLNGQSLALIGILLLSGFGWAVAVKD